MRDPYAVLPRDFYRRACEHVARDLLGRYLVRHHRGRRLVLRIVETEAYLGPRDRASHAWGGRRTARTESLYLPPGHAYVYLIYGLHHCLNAVVTGAGEAVLVRAGEAVGRFFPHPGFGDSVEPEKTIREAQRRHPDPTPRIGQRGVHCACYQLPFIA